jgi:hypothetical protein
MNHMPTLAQMPQLTTEQAMDEFHMQLQFAMNESLAMQQQHMQQHQQ